MKLEVSNMRTPGAADSAIHDGAVLCGYLAEIDSKNFYLSRFAYLDDIRQLREVMHEAMIASKTATNEDSILRYPLHLSSMELRALENWISGSRNQEQRLKLERTVDLLRARWSGWRCGEISDPAQIPIDVQRIIQYVKGGFRYGFSTTGLSLLQVSEVVEGVKSGKSLLFESKSGVVSITDLGRKRLTIHFEECRQTKSKLFATRSIDESIQEFLSLANGERRLAIKRELKSAPKAEEVIDNVGALQLLKRVAGTPIEQVGSVVLTSNLECLRDLYTRSPGLFGPFEMKRVPAFLKAEVFLIHKKDYFGLKTVKHNLRVGHEWLVAIAERETEMRKPISRVFEDFLSKCEHFPGLFSQTARIAMPLRSQKIFSALLAQVDAKARLGLQLETRFEALKIAHEMTLKSSEFSSAEDSSGVSNSARVSITARSLERIGQELAEKNLNGRRLEFMEVASQAKAIASTVKYEPL